MMLFACIIGYFLPSIRKNEEGHWLGYFITTIVAEVVLGIHTSTIVAWLSRKREFKVDEVGTTLGHDRRPAVPESGVQCS